MSLHFTPRRRVSAASITYIPISTTKTREGSVVYCLLELINSTLGYHMIIFLTSTRDSRMTGSQSFCSKFCLYKPRVQRRCDTQDTKSANVDCLTLWLSLTTSCLSTLQVPPCSNQFWCSFFCLLLLLLVRVHFLYSQCLEVFFIQHFQLI